MRERVVMTYAVDVLASRPTVLQNQAQLIQPDGHVDDAATMVLVDPVRIYVPIVVR